MAAVLKNFVNSFTNKLDPPVRRHLKNVYGCLSLSVVATAVGAFMHLYVELVQANLLAALGAFGLLFALTNTPDNGKNQSLRLSYLLGFGFLTGLGLGPLLQVVIKINPSIIVTALAGVAVVFVSFSMAALLAQRGYWLYLGGMLMSVLNVMILLMFFNFFLQWSVFYQLNLYVGLFLMCGFVIFDTQMIVEKFHMGSKDFILHSMDLFIDFINIFRYLLVLLTQKEVKKQCRREN